MLEEIIPLLLDWYQHYKRDLPWRKDTNPYHIWISEIMLQQTRVEAVIPYYERFMNQLPTLIDLANVSDDKLLKLWEGLGYYSRARNLKKAAQMVLLNGQNSLPTSYQDLLKLPGIGTYTAGAIASISYQEKVPAVDGNVLRVLTRVLALYDDIKDLKTKKKIEQLLQPFMPERAGNFNQALMELGATICIPNGNPRCNICPISTYCKAYQKGLLAVLPVKGEKKKRKIFEKTVFIYTYQNTYAIHKRSNKGLLASLYEFPNMDTYIKKEELEEQYSNVRKLKPYHHIFTHLEWHMIGYQIVVSKKDSNYLWVTLEELQTIYSIPTVFQPFLKQVL